ncbi:MAG: hypothetical protein IEMM0006_1847 [bacterium]|nr:MAG: hypothetical protein IEMM0006_1847 [bacterium]
MELIMYHLAEVKTRKQKKEFLRLPAFLYRLEEDKNWISPLYSDMKRFFDPDKNPLFEEGEMNRWLLYDVNKHLLGRIAAFYLISSLREKVPTGYFGFFECTDDKEGSGHLFDVARNWLVSKGIKAMQGPVFLSKPGIFSGSLIRGFYAPVYGMPYNFPYYNDLFLDYGFKEIQSQNTYRISLDNSPYWKFVGKKAVKFYHDLRYRFEAFEPEEIEQYADDFAFIYNKMWLGFPGMIPMTKTLAEKWLKSLRPVLNKRTIVFGYFEDKPIAFLITIPDIHHILKKFSGKYNLFYRLYLWLVVRILKDISTLSGISYGIVPEYAGENVEAALFDSFKELLKLNKLKFNELKLSRVGDFAPGMKKIAEQLGGEIYHQYIIYQLLFDEVEKEKTEPGISS